MDDLTLRYYEAEMRYLREAGKEFARAHPDRAAMLNLDKPGARDPYVERLFEGFAFLMGRLREKLDDDLPELTEGLVSLLWPHYMRTIPSLAIVEFSPDWRSLRQAEMLAEGFSVLSRPVGPHKTACQYRTTRDVPYNPCNLRMRACILKPMAALLSVCASNALKKWTGVKPGSTKSPFSQRRKSGQFSAASGNDPSRTCHVCPSCRDIH
jgi:type VI protein secretion system component VasA